MEWVPTSQIQKEIAIKDAKEEKAFEIAVNCLKKGIPMDTIVAITGLDKDAILGHNF